LKHFAAFFVVLFGASLARSATYFVYDVKTADGSPELARSLKSLVVSAVGSAGGEVIETAAQADFDLRVELVRLGQAYVLTVTQSKHGAAPYGSRQKAASLEELDEAIDRAVRAALLSTPAKQDVRVGEVRERDEQQLQRRIRARNAKYFGFGPAGLTNLGTSALSYEIALGYLWEVTPNSAIRALGNGVWTGDFRTYFFMAQLGLNYYFSDASSSPYLAFGFGFAASGSGTTTATSIGGFAGTAGWGWQFFRTSTNQLDLFAGYSGIFGNNTIGAPGYYGARIGVLF